MERQHGLKSSISAMAGLSAAAAAMGAAISDMASLMRSTHSGPHHMMRGSKSRKMWKRIYKNQHHRPHQGPKEIARRAKQLAMGQLDFSASGQAIYGRKRIEKMQGLR